MAKAYNNLNDYDDIKLYIEAIFRHRGFGDQVKWRVLGDEKQRKLIDIKFLQPYVSQLFNCDIVIIINHELFERISVDEENILICIEEGLDSIGYSIEKGVYKIKRDYLTSSEFQKVKGLEKVARAKEIEKELSEALAQEQKENK